MALISCGDLKPTGLHPLQTPWGLLMVTLKWRRNLNPVQLTDSEVTTMDRVLERFFSWMKLIKFVAWMLRYQNNLRVQSLRKRPTVAMLTKGTAKKVKFTSWNQSWLTESWGSVDAYAGHHCQKKLVIRRSCHDITTLQNWLSVTITSWQATREGNTCCPFLEARSGWQRQTREWGRCWTSASTVGGRLEPWIRRWRTFLRTEWLQTSPHSAMSALTSLDHSSWSKPGLKWSVRLFSHLPHCACSTHRGGSLPRHGFVHWCISSLRCQKRKASLNQKWQRYQLCQWWERDPQ